MVENGEDGTFCDKVRKAGMDVWCDGNITVGHLGEYEFKSLDDNYVTSI